MFNKISEEIDSRNGRLKTRFTFEGSLTELVKNFKTEDLGVLTFYVEPTDSEPGVPNVGGCYNFSNADIIDDIFYEMEYIHIGILKEKVDLFLLESNEIVVFSDSPVDLNNYFKKKVSLGL